VIAANGVRVLVDRRGYTPTPAVSRAILAKPMPPITGRAGGGEAGSGGRDRGHRIAEPDGGRRLQVQRQTGPGRDRGYQAIQGTGERPDSATG